MAAASKGILGCLLSLLMLTVRRRVWAMSNCETQAAICTFNGRLQGTILFRENHGFGCSNFGDSEGLHMQIDVHGFDRQDNVTSHNFRVKSYAGSLPSCVGMEPDYEQGFRSPDLGMFPERSGGVVQVADVMITNGPTLLGQQSVVGRSIAVIKGDSNTYQQYTPEVLGCCIIGLANLQQLQPGRIRHPTPTNSLNNNNNNNNNNPIATNKFSANSNRTPFFNPFGAPAVRRQSASVARPTPQKADHGFLKSQFRSPFNLDNKLSFFDLSGKTSRVSSSALLPDSVQSKFKAPEGPRFQDIYGLDSGESPLSRSGYGNAMRPSKGSKLSQMFFQDQELQSAMNMGLTAEEIDIPRESGDEESTRSFHEDKAVEKDPGYEDALDGPDADYAQYDDEASESFNTPQPANGPLPPEYGSSDPSHASFLRPSHDDDSQQNIDISENYHNGETVNADVSNRESQGTADESSRTTPQDAGQAAGDDPTHVASSDGNASQSAITDKVSHPMGGAYDARALDIDTNTYTANR